MGQDILYQVLCPTDTSYIDYLEASYNSSFILSRPGYILEQAHGCSKLHLTIYVYPKLPWLLRTARADSQYTLATP